jgi:hypothetical protein
MDECLIDCMGTIFKLISIDELYSKSIQCAVFQERSKTDTFNREEGY